MGFFDIFKKNNQNNNKYNKTFFWGLNGLTNNDDTNLPKYIDDGYNVNSDVFSIVNQMSTKLISIPYYIKDVKDNTSKNKLNNLLKAANYKLSFSQKVKASILENKALTEQDYDMPFDRPNPNQDWNEFFKLSHTFLTLTGNVYWYKLMPKEGMNAGAPIQVYCLPSHLMTIKLKKNSDSLGLEDPIDYFEMDNYNYLTKFQREEVVHISLDNPNYGLNGEQLYGQSKLRAVWKNVLASNKGLDLNIEMLKNAGVFGFIHAKGNNFNEGQGKAIKDRILEAKNSSEDLSNIMGASVDMGFTRISLTPDELKIFDHLKYNQKSICNALGWSDALLNNDDGGKYDKQTSELKRVLTNTIIPDSKILEKAFNEGILSQIKEYKGKVLLFDYKDLPELQSDLKELTEWTSKLVDKGSMNRYDQQLTLGITVSEDPNMKLYTVNEDVLTLEQAINDFPLNEPNNAQAI